MKLLVLGASGGVGREVVRLAVARGHAVTAVVRPTTPFAPQPGVGVARVDVLREGRWTRSSRATTPCCRRSG
ncbi:MAG: NAD(P)H-binding protein [Bryobacterales bacterium]